VKAIGLQNNTKFSFNGDAGIVITDEMISVSDCPNPDPDPDPDKPTCVGTQASTIASDAQAEDKTFIRVDIPSGSLATFFARVPTTQGGTGNQETRTYGRAVAGRFIVDVTPIGVCAIKNEGVSRPEGEALPGTNELAQFGFRRGVSYNIFEFGPLSPTSYSDPYLLNPLDSYPNSCIPNNSSADAAAPFICSGASAFNVASGFVYGNTGYSVGKIEAALNSRFNDYKSPSVCSPAQAPPDINIKNFGCTDTKCATPAADWMAQTKQTITPTGIPTATVPIPAGITSKNQYGVLWSYSHAVTADTSTPPKPGTAFPATAATWATLYPAPGGAPAPNGNYPAVGAPYQDTTAGHSTPPIGNSGAPDRRLLNMVIADCPNTTGSGSCQVIKVLGIGQFFMQVPADFKGSPKKLEVEFAGLIEPIPTVEIKLYR
jgi:hypothetical protein